MGVKDWPLEKFGENGVARVPQVLSKEEVKSLREHLLRKADEKSTSESAPTYLSGLLFHDEKLQGLFFIPKIVESLKAVLGADYAILPEATAHRGYFSTWHQDTETLEGEGFRFHFDPEYRIVQAGIYLQDNTAERGGGLDVVPRSHHWRSRLKRAWILRALRKCPWLVSSLVQTIPSEAGDLVVFDLRMIHQGSQPRGPQPTGAEAKLSIFMACSRNNPCAAQYAAYLKDVVTLKSEHYKQFMDRHRIDDKLRAQAKALGICFVP